MLEGIETGTEMVMYVDQVGDLRGGTLISLSIHGDKIKEFITLNKGFQKKRCLILDT